MNKKKHITHSPNQQSQSVDSSKRKVVLGAAAGGAVALWHKPVVDAVILPAHAQTSTAATVFFSAAAAVTPLAKTTSPLDFLISSANAGTAMMQTSEYAVMVEQTTAGVDSYAISLFERILEGENNRGEALFSGTASVAGGGTLTIADDPCMLNLGPITLTIDSVSEAQVELSLTSRSQRLIVPAGTGSLPTPMCVDTGLPESYYNAAASATPAVAKSSPMDWLIPTANAGLSGPPSGTFAVLATKINEETFDVGLVNINGNVLRQGMISTNGDQGSLNFVENACNAQGGPRSIPASIQSIDESQLILRIVTDERGTFDLTVPVGSGMLTTTCEPMGDFTNRGRSNAKRDKGIGESLLDLVIPEAQAGLTQSDALRDQTIANASSAGGGSYMVEIAISEAALDGNTKSSQILSVLTANIALNGGSATAFTVTSGCNVVVEGTLVANSVNQLALSLTTELASATLTLSPGNTPIDPVGICILDAQG